VARRCAAALGLLVLTGLVLSRVAPHPATVLAAMDDPQKWAGIHGPDAAILTVAVAAAWLLLGWLTLGLAVGLAAALPGAAGRSAHALARVVLPRAIQQAVAVTLGIGLVTAGSSVAAADPGPAGPGSSASSGASVDWPIRPPSSPAPPPVPGGPPRIEDPITDDVMVQPGDSLWAIAAHRLGPDATSGEIASAVTSWYQRNRDLIGPDRDLIHPGQRLVPPAVPPSS